MRLALGGPPVVHWLTELCLGISSGGALNGPPMLRGSGEIYLRRLKQQNLDRKNHP